MDQIDAFVIIRNYRGRLEQKIRNRNRSNPNPNPNPNQQHPLLNPHTSHQSNQSPVLRRETRRITNSKLEHPSNTQKQQKPSPPLQTGMTEVTVFPECSPLNMCPSLSDPFIACSSDDEQTCELKMDPQDSIMTEDPIREINSYFTF